MGNNRVTPKAISKSFQFGKHEVTLETGEIARQASGAVMVKMDDTVVFGEFFVGWVRGIRVDSEGKVLSDRMTEMAHTDTLTETYNRLHFNDFLEAEIDKVKRYGGTFSIIFFDLDHFKQINDTHGHNIGDNILKEVTDIIKSANRSSDIFARYGGEEFVILAASTNMRGAYDHAKRLKRDIEQHQFSIGRVTCSFGVTEFIPGSDTMTTILERADAALYDAKAEGRNCVMKR